MIWYLLFCTAGSGYRCNPPLVMLSKAACEFVAKHQQSMTERAGYYGSTRCVGVRK